MPDSLPSTTSQTSTGGLPNEVHADAGTDSSSLVAKRLLVMTMIASGGAVALCSLFSRPISGASMNPARSLAPAVMSGELHDRWIYLVAPVGAALATLTMRVLHSHEHHSEREAAQGR